MHQHATGDGGKGGNGDGTNHDSILMTTMTKATTAIRAMAEVIIKIKEHSLALITKTIFVTCIRLFITE